MQTLYTLAFWSTLAIEAAALAFVTYVFIWIFAALDVVL